MYKDGYTCVETHRGKSAPTITRRWWSLPEQTTG